MKSQVLKLLMAVLVLHTIVLPLSNTIAVIFGYILLILTAILPINLLSYSEKKINKNQFFIILGMVIIVLLNLAISIFSMGFNEYEEIIKALVSFVSFLFSMAVCEISYSERDLKYYFTLNRILSLVFIVYTIIPFPFRYVVANTYGYKQFTLSMGNPNATAAKVMFCVALLLIQLKVSDRRSQRVVNILLITGLLYTLYMLESRTALLCAVYAIILSCFVKYRVTRRFATLVWLVPILFIPIQIFLENFSFVTLIGKSLITGRNTMFSEFLIEIMQSPLKYILGDFCGYGLSNLHNIIFTVLFNFGVLGLALYLAFWFQENKRLSKPISLLNNTAWIALTMFIIHSASEAAPMSGAFVYGLFVVILNRLTKDNLVTNQGAKGIGEK